MKKITFLLLFSILVSTFAMANCDNAYSTATYALAHTKRALKADNFDHQKYYAERALEAFQKTEGLVKDCGCNDAINPILDGIDHLKDAIDPNDWDMGRYHTKRALAFVQDALTAMDIFSRKNDAVSQSVEEDTDSALEENSDYQNLVEQQKQLAEQLKFKKAAEQSLFNLEKSIKEMANLYGCNDALSILKTYETRKDEVLSKETLKDTRNYYMQQTISMEAKALEALKKCTSTSSK